MWIECSTSGDALVRSRSVYPCTGRNFSTYPILEHLGNVAVDEAPGVYWGNLKLCVVQSLDNLSLNTFGFLCRRPLAVDREGDDHVALGDMCRHPVCPPTGLDGTAKVSFLLAPAILAFMAGGLEQA